jgi:hypothetical protein
MFTSVLNNGPRLTIFGKFPALGPHVVTGPERSLPMQVPKLKACSQLLVTSLNKVEALTDKLIIREVEDSDQACGLFVIIAFLSAGLL